jgi:hypothetical protein
MLIRNITSANINVTGVTITPDEVIELSDLGSREDLSKNTTEIISFFNNNSIQFEYTDGYIQTEIQKIYSLLQNGFISVGVEEAQQRYYYLKDNMKITKSDIIEKTFNGKLKALTITPSQNDVFFTIITSDGIQLQPESLSKKQTIEFDFADGLINPIIRITSSRTANVDIFMEGTDCQCKAKLLQRFINTWKEDRDEWITTKPVFTCRWYDTNMCSSPDLVEDDVNGHTAVFPFSRIDGNVEYKIYHDDEFEYTIERTISGKWEPFNIDRYGVRVKNVKYAQFADGTINLYNTNSNDTQDHIDDKLGD